MAEQNNPQSPKPGKARRVAMKIAQAAGESLMMRSPILGQAFEMTQMFKRPEQSEEGKQPSRLGNIMSIVRQSLVQNSTILRKIEMFKDTFDTFREDEDEQKKDGPGSKEKTNDSSTQKKQGDDAKPSSTFVEYLDNKENPYYLMMQDSKNYLEKIVELLTEQKRVLERSMQIESEKSERQKSLSELGSVGREPDAMTQIRTGQTLPPAITEGLGSATPQQQDDEGGWFSELIDDTLDFAKKRWKGLAVAALALLSSVRNRLMGGLSSIWSSIKGLGRGLGSRGAPRGVTALPRTAPPPLRAPTPVTTPSAAPPVGPTAPAVPSAAPPVGPTAPAAPSAAPPVGPTAPSGAAPLAAPAAAIGTTAIGSTAAALVAAGTTLTGILGTAALGYTSVNRSEELRQQYPELRGLNLGLAEEEYLVQRPELLAQAVEEARRSGTFDRNMRAYDRTYGMPAGIQDRAVGGLTPYAPPDMGAIQEYLQQTPSPAVNTSSEQIDELMRYLNGLTSPSTTKTQTLLDTISRPSVPLSFGPMPSAAPVILNNQGGPTNINNGGNVTNIVTGGASLALPQLTFNLPSVMN